MGGEPGRTRSAATPPFPPRSGQPIQLKLGIPPSDSASLAGFTRTCRARWLYSHPPRARWLHPHLPELHLHYPGPTSFTGTCPRLSSAASAPDLIALSAPAPGLPAHLHLPQAGTRRARQLHPHPPRAGSPAYPAPPAPAGSPA
jgi:hypothetical protein